MSQLAVQRVTEACANYTFCPHLSQQSLRIMQHMEADFQARQQRHLLRRQRTVLFVIIHVQYMYMYMCILY